LECILSVDEKAEAALTAAMQNVIDNDGEKKIQDGNISTESNSLGDMANFIKAASAAGIKLGTRTTRTIGTRIG